MVDSLQNKVNEWDYYSFRDASGATFYREGIFYRKINLSYKRHFDYFMECGLYRELLDHNLTVPFDEVTAEFNLNPSESYVIKPQHLPFISYPYEWCFEQLKLSALTTLKIQMMALNKNMMLKDASAFNVQFFSGGCLLIDTLSFEIYRENATWPAYYQFCKHFIAPLALMKELDLNLITLFKIYLDGFPLELTSKMLPWKSGLNFLFFSHLHLHSMMQSYFSKKVIKKNAKEIKIKKGKLISLCENLYELIEKLDYKVRKTSWSHYSSCESYSKEAFEDKEKAILFLYTKIVPRPKLILDIGANQGHFSRLIDSSHAVVVSTDVDPLAVDLNFQKVLLKKEKNIYPIVVDFTNPTPALGWNGTEKRALYQRLRPDVTFLLALIHHLVIYHNIPFMFVAKSLRDLSSWIIVEFIDREDPQVQLLLKQKNQNDEHYAREQFLTAFNAFFEIIHSIKINNSKRELFLMKKRDK